MLISVAIHMFLMACCAGKTTLATTQRPRRHMTTARAGTEDSTFHDILKNTTEPHWTLVPVELVDSEELGCYRDRDWWHIVQQWALNDTTPVLLSANTAVLGAQHTKQLQTTLRQAHIATVNRDYARDAILNQDMQRVAAHLNISFCRPTNVTVLYIRPAQRSHVTHLINTMVRNATLTSWECKAARARILLMHFFIHPGQLKNQSFRNLFF